VGVHDVRWENESTVRPAVYNFFFRKGNENNQLGTGFFVYILKVSAVKRI
jgi:hypothetical protein